MRILEIIFRKERICISQVPDKGRLDIVATARHKNFILIKTKDGKLYCPSWWRGKGLAVVTWYSDRALDYLPALHRLQGLPESCTIKEARRINKEEDKRYRRMSLISDITENCKALGIKPPKFPKP